MIAVGFLKFTVCECSTEINLRKVKSLDLIETPCRFLKINLTIASNSHITLKFHCVYAMRSSLPSKKITFLKLRLMALHKLYALSVISDFNM